jgi:hypothetical protein
MNATSAAMVPFAGRPAHPQELMHGYAEVKSIKIIKL